MGMETRNTAEDAGSAVDLYWIPLGTGQHVVRLSGRLYEAICARLQRRQPCDLYHSALIVVVPEGRFVIEQTQVPGRGGPRGVVLEGAVGTRLAGRFRLFRYELRRWRDGVIPDISAAVSSPVRVSDDLACAERILDLTPFVPALVWGRDENHAGEMWNSNSVTSWLLASAGIDADSLQPPHRGRAPGWRSGLVVAARAAARAETGSRRLIPRRRRTSQHLRTGASPSPARAGSSNMPRRSSKEASAD